jgi:hypothetical protein
MRSYSIFAGDRQTRRYYSRDSRARRAQKSALLSVSWYNRCYAHVVAVAGKMALGRVRRRGRAHNASLMLQLLQKLDIHDRECRALSA